MSLVSAIIPVYNCSQYLAKGVNSILNQTYRDIEILLVNDGSTDASKDICDALAQENSNVRVFHTPNRGVSAARNTGLENCRGEFVTYVDADDTLVADAIEAMVDGAQTSHGDIVIGSFKKVSPQGEVFGTLRDADEDIVRSKAEVVEYTLTYLRNPRQSQMLMSCWAKLFRASIIKENDIWFDTNLDLAEDIAFNFEYLKYVEKALFLEKVVYHHQKTGGYDSLSMKIPENPSKLFVCTDVLNSIEGFLLQHDPAMDVRRELGHYYAYQAALFLVRLCGQIDDENSRKVRKFIGELINGAVFRDYIKDYVPAAGNYRLIPWLMKYRLTWPLISVCKHEAKKLYTDTK